MGLLLLSSSDKTVQAMRLLRVAGGFRPSQYVERAPLDAVSRLEREPKASATDNRQVLFSQIAVHSGDLPCARFLRVFERAETSQDRQRLYLLLVRRRRLRLSFFVNRVAPCSSVAFAQVFRQGRIPPEAGRRA